MAQYAEVPEWAYLALTVFAIILGCVGLTAYPTNASVSSIFFGIFLCIVSLPIAYQSGDPELRLFFCQLLVIPIGIITSITGVQVTLNVFAEFIGGLIYPENALAMNFFKSFGVVTCMNAIAFAQDLKLAHYMKIGQRYTFAVQVYGAIIACFVSTAVVNYQLTIPNVCEADQKDHFICNGENSESRRRALQSSSIHSDSFLPFPAFFTASVFWGTLGPTRVFGAGGI